MTQLKKPRGQPAGDFPKTAPLRTRPLLAPAVISCVLLLFGPARAEAGERCPAPSWGSPRLAELDPAVRLGRIRAALDRESDRARLWSGVWAMTFIGAGTFALSRGVTSDDEGAQFAAVAASLKSTLQPLSIVLRPLRVMKDAGELERRAAAGEDTCSLVRESEEWLRLGAANEAALAGWTAHAALLLVNVGVYLLEGFGYQRWREGLLGAGVGIALSELKILTQPTALDDELDAYARAEGFAPVAPAVSVVPQLGAAGGGLGLVVRF